MNTVIDIRDDGPHVVADPRTTVQFTYTPELLNQLRTKQGVDAESTSPDVIFIGGVAAGLGAFFDALRSKGVPFEQAQELMWAAHENLKKKP